MKRSAILFCAKPYCVKKHTLLGDLALSRYNDFAMGLKYWGDRVQYVSYGFNQNQIRSLGHFGGHNP